MKCLLENKKYNEVYSSSVFSAITSLCNVENNVYLKEGTKVFRARIVKDDDVYQERKGISGGYFRENRTY